MTVTSRRLKSQFWGLYNLFLIKLYEMTVIIFCLFEIAYKKVMHTEHNHRGLFSVHQIFDVISS